MHSYAAHMLCPSAERPDAGQSNKLCMLSKRKTAKVFIKYQPHSLIVAAKIKWLKRLKFSELCVVEK